MGAEARCRATINGHPATGNALLEATEVVFRGEGLRAAIALAELTAATASDGLLELRTSRDVLQLELGAKAAKWLEKIRNPPSRLEKLGIRAGTRVALVGVDDADLRAELDARGAVVARTAAGADVVLLQVETPARLARLAGLRDAIPPHAAIWVLRVKGGKGVSEKETMAAGRAAGLVDVKVCAFSDRLTAEKYVIPTAARSPARPAAAGRRSTRRPRR